MSDPRVAIAPPPAWSAVDVAPPPLADASGARLTQWEAWAPAHANETLVAGCVATPIPGWVEEMRPSVTARAAGLAITVSERTAGSSITATPQFTPQGESLRIDPAGRTLNHSPIGTARVFVGFPIAGSENGSARVFTCFVSCVARRGEGSTSNARSTEESEPTCSTGVREARLDNHGAPPPPGLALSMTTWSVHHPREVGLGLGLTAILAGGLAVMLRWRPRSRAF